MTTAFLPFGDCAHFAGGHPQMFCPVRRLIRRVNAWATVTENGESIRLGSDWFPILYFDELDVAGRKATAGFILN